MTTCSSCSVAVPDGSRFCAGCGAPVETSSQADTQFATQKTGAACPISSGSNPSSSSSSIDDSRFTAGTVVADRYRIIGRVGKGGMGEVYRADDLKLEQTVALKFLPETLSQDPDRLARFHGEVRIARQVSHPNVCRVYDIGEVEGQHYLSMEFVDGEDLASLLRRIGRFSRDKAVEIGRQVCAGMAAAHERGVIHRDLKPANIMIDGTGKVRITDFGLASLVGDTGEGAARVGTPAYMAPEQREGKGVTIRSDIYSLGLVLYELFTGKRALSGGKVSVFPRSTDALSVTSPTNYVPELDQAVERVILRCLENDPRLRPATVLAVAAALPGGDPLAAALAAGETPSPEMVAAAGEAGALSPVMAWSSLLLVVVGLVVGLFLSASSRIVNWIPIGKPPAALAERARDLIDELGHDPVVADTAYQFSTNGDYLRYIRDNDDSPNRWEQLKTGQPPGLFFWYRQSPRDMVPQPGFTTVSFGDPPQTLAGMAKVALDPEGRLRRFEFIPPQKEEATEAGIPAAETNWSILFTEAGFDQSLFTPTPSTWTPPMHTDTRAAWTGAFPDRPESSIRVEAASYRGQPVYFRIIGDWTRPEREQAVPVTTMQKVGQRIGLGILAAAILGAIVLARRNIKMGRGDTAGAFKIALFFVLTHIFVWIFWASHMSDFPREYRIFMLDTGYTLFLASIVWLLYVALEPFVRRRWPDTLISWSRMLGGRFRDPLVGRDILFGSAAGGLMFTAITLVSLLPVWMGKGPPIPDNGVVNGLMGLRDSIPRALDAPVHAIFSTMQVLLLLLLLRILLRKQWLALGALGAIFTTLITLNNELPLLVLPLAVVTVTLFLFTLVRFGLLAATVTLAFVNILSALPMTSQLTTWHGSGTAVALLACVLLAGYGFLTAMAGKPLFTGGLLDED